MSLLQSTMVTGVAAVLLSCAGVAAQAPRHNVVLVTLDGARPEEIFGGLDLDILRASIGEKTRAEETETYRRFWDADARRRREKLMPFFWGTLMRQHGSIAGNRALGSTVRLSNRLWFSYPGYSEILVGRARDDLIKSNDPVRNPSRTVLEFVRERLRLPREGVAAFGSWNVFNAIAESQEGAITINAGYEAYEHPDERVRALSALQFSTPTPWDSVRHDVYTAKLGMAHLETYQPRVLYLALGETDDWAHDGRYDRVLDAYRRSDDLLRDLWTWLQAHPSYRDATSLLITTDHGRGEGPSGWRHHGAKYPASEFTWMAFVTPHLRQRGEWGPHEPIEARQVPTTMLRWLGIEAREFDAAAGPPVAGGSN